MKKKKKKKRQRFRRCHLRSLLLRRRSLWLRVRHTTLGQLQPNPDCISLSNQTVLCCDKISYVQALSRQRVLKLLSLATIFETPIFHRASVQRIHPFHSTVTTENAGDDSWDDDDDEGNEDGGEPDLLRTQNVDKLVPNEDRNLGDASEQSPRRRPSGETGLVSDGGNERSGSGGTISVGRGEHQREAQRGDGKVGTWLG